MNTGFAQLPKVQPISARDFVVLEDEEFVGADGDCWTIPKGFVTDLASVPRFLWSLLAPFGLYTAAAVLHDYLCRIAAGVIESYDPVREARHTAQGWLYGGLAGDTSGLPLYVSRHDADGILRLVMRLEGVPLPTRWAMWSAVRLNSGLSGATWRERGQWLFTALLVLPIVLIPSAVNLIFEALVWLINLPFASQARGEASLTSMRRDVAARENTDRGW